MGATAAMADQSQPRRQKRKRPQETMIDDSVVRAVFERLDTNGTGVLEVSATAAR